MLLPRRHNLSQMGNLARAAAHGAASVVKTTVLRQDRTTPAEYEARLNTCRNCPGGHATFKADGSLHICGDMISAMAEDKDGVSGATSESVRPKPCGCLLKKKALDRTESCPFGYWPTLNGRAIEDEAQAEVQSTATLASSTDMAASESSTATAGDASDLIVAGGSSSVAHQGRIEAPRKKKGCGCGCGKRKASTFTSGGGGGSVQPYSDAQMRHFLARRRAVRKPQPFDPSRRRFMGQTAAGAAGLTLASHTQWAHAAAGKYFKAKDCGGNEAYIARDTCPGLVIGDMYTDATDPEVCWRIISCETLESAPSSEIDCPSGSCECCCGCGNCCFGSMSTFDVTRPTITYLGISNPLGGREAQFVNSFNSISGPLVRQGVCAPQILWHALGHEYTVEGVTYCAEWVITKSCFDESWDIRANDVNLTNDSRNFIAGINAFGNHIPDHGNCCGFEWTEVQGSASWNISPTTGTATLDNNKCCKCCGQCKDKAETYDCDEVSGATEACDDCTCVGEGDCLTGGSYPDQLIISLNTINAVSCGSKNHLICRTDASEYLNICEQGNLDYVRLYKSGDTWKAEVKYGDCDPSPDTDCIGTHEFQRSTDADDPIGTYYKLVDGVPTQTVGELTTNEP